MSPCGDKQTPAPRPDGSVYYDDGQVTVHHGDCRDVLAGLPDASVDSVCTDPPYELGFMGKTWDASGIAYDPAMWRECLRVLKPGGHLLAFGGTRTYHRMTSAIEDAGFEIRDSIHWIYGSGFPKSLDVSKAIDKARTEDRAPVDAVRAWLNARRIEAGYSHDAVNKHFGHASNGGGSSSAWMTNPTSRSLPTWEQWLALKSLFGFGDDMDAEVWRLNGNKGKPGEAWDRREVVGTKSAGMGTGPTFGMLQSEGDNANAPHLLPVTAPATPEAAAWSGWGTALKPSHEPIVVARKPLASPGINVLQSLESALRAHGVTGEIEWTNGPVSGAAKPVSPATSSSTDPQPAEATSADPAVGSVTRNDARQTASSSAPTKPPGARLTATTSGPIADGRQPNSERKSSPPTETPAPAAANELPTSSPSITSTGAEPPTVKRPGERSTSRSSAKASPPVTASFAGIATGLSGSRATVRIDRLADGTFAWPEGLPTYVPGGPCTVAGNVLAHGTGAINVDGCRVPGEPWKAHRATGLGSVKFFTEGENPVIDKEPHTAGRWPANVVLDEAAAAELDAQSGERPGMARAILRRGATTGQSIGGSSAYGTAEPHEAVAGYGDTGGASRFFPVFKYEPKAPTAERPRVDGTAHATVKPLDLMRWLVRLVTPPGGTVLEPFAGSGTTAEACVVEGFRCIAIEADAAHLPLIKARLAKPIQPVLFAEEGGRREG